MQSDATPVIRIKPRILIADDSRIVRATLIKHIQGLFEFREAFDGEHAWETLLVDPSIRVVITDLTMPKLDGYGLLQRIRASRISRIRLMPVIVISGSDAQEERDRAKAAGATELITKGIATAQLLSRLDTLSQLVSTQQDFERGLEILVQGVPAAADTLMASAAMFAAAADAMLNFAIRHQRSFVLLHVCVALRDAPDGVHTAPDLRVVDAIGGLLRHTIRQTDCVARVGRAEFTLATNGINPDAAYGFAERICGAIANAKLPEQDMQALIASCGLAYVTEDENATPRLEALRETAQRRARLGLRRRVSGVVGALDEVEPGV